MVGESLTADVEGIDHKVASPECEKTRRCRQCGHREALSQKEPCQHVFIP